MRSENCDWSRAWHLVSLFGIVLVAGSVAQAGEWPQILGPNRNGIADNEAAIKPWPATGPTKKWAAEIGAGFAGPAVVGTRVVLFHRVGKIERVECFETTTGRSMWQSVFPASYPGGVNPDNGPRCVPVIHGEHVYLCGAAGDVHCVTLAAGKQIWSREAYREYKVREGYFGAGSTPIVADGKVLMNVGGAQAGIVAFDATSGKTAWQVTSEQASYSSPTLATINGRPHAIFITRLKCLALDPRDGKIAFEFPFGKTGPTVNAATPLVFDDQLFVTASYEIGGRLARLATAAQPIWANDESMSSQYTTCVQRGGFLYGVHGREDFQNGELRCVEARTGIVKWSQPGFGVGHLILVGDQLLILTTEGQLVLTRAASDKYSELARATISRDVTRCMPALANGQLLVRDNGDSGGRLTCWSLQPD